MSLPRLPELNDDFEIQDKKPISNKEKLQDKEKPNNEKPRTKKPRIPKSEYDSDGNPVLTIPDLDDINLLNEIDKYFGKEVDD